MPNIYVPLQVHTGDLVDAIHTKLTYPEIKQLIIDIDSMIADVEFTEELVQTLVKSLKGCYDQSDMPDFINWEKV